jgi:hypothetical protein
MLSQKFQILTLFYYELKEIDDIYKLFDGLLSKEFINSIINTDDTEFTNIILRCNETQTMIN